MASSASHDEVVSLVQDALKRLGLDPKPIPHGRIDELRGGFLCLELEGEEGVDAAVLASKLNVKPFQDSDSKILYNVDYTVRGDLRGVLPGRLLSSTGYEVRGLFRKKLTGLRWETPVEERRGSPVAFDGFSPPRPGELWEGGPHQTLTERLNQDDELNAALRAFMGVVDAPLVISVFSDGWGESLRIRGDQWFNKIELAKTYVSQDYLKIIDQIGRHIKEVRRKFGGITF